MAGRDRDDARRDSSPQPWHNRTPVLLGASAVALLVIGLLIVVAMAVSRQFSEPEEAPLDFVEPTFSATATQSAATPTTTQTITSTSPPETTNIDGPSSTSTTSSSETTSDETTARRGGNEDDDRPSRTTRRGPRTNVTRTLNPYP